MRPTIGLRVPARRNILLLQTAPRPLLTLRHTPVPAALSSSRRVCASPSQMWSPSSRRLFSDNAPAASSESTSESNPRRPRYKVVKLADREYHDIADEYLDLILTRYEDMVEETGDLDVELAAGVMTVSVPNIGTYVINKQPPNKQIWLSSPISGPKRYDYVEYTDPESGTKVKDWVYMRESTSLRELLLTETKLDLEE